MAMSDVYEIPELKNANVHIKDKEELLRKLNLLIKDGHTKLQVVTDFDHTLTRHRMDDGKMVLTSFGMFRECPSVPQYYKDEDNRLASIYKPIECDPHMSVEEKTQHMVEWYLAAHKILKGLKFPRSELMDIAHKMIQCFRRGAGELMSWCEAQRVPVLVFSAGLGECVVAALGAANYLLPNVKVVSNFLSMDDEDKIIGIKGEVIHVYNKNETAIKHTAYYEMVKERSNVVLMGDNLGDAGMAEGMEHCHVVLKIGFLGHNTAANLPQYLDKFDVVLVDEPTMDVANAILQRIFFISRH